MTCCESCGSHDVTSRNKVLTCNECGYTRDYKPLLREAKELLRNAEKGLK